MQGVVLACYLGVGAFMDGKRKKINISYLWLGVILALGFLWEELYYGNLTVLQIILRLFPGIFFLIVGRLTGEKVGYGDGLLLLILGGCLTFPVFWYVWLAALFLLTIWAGILLAAGKGNRNTKIPFLPFLWLANMIIWGFGYG